MPISSSIYSDPSASDAKALDWSEEDFIDFEYAIRLESQEKADRIRDRYRRIRDRLSDSQPNQLINQVILRRWLEAVRNSSFPKSISPGSAIGEGLSFASKARASRFSTLKPLEGNSWATGKTLAAATSTPFEYSTPARLISAIVSTFWMPLKA